MKLQNLADTGKMDPGSIPQEHLNSKTVSLRQYKLIHKWYTQITWKSQTRQSSRARHAQTTSAEGVEGRNCPHHEGNFWKDSPNRENSQVSDAELM